MFVTRSRRTLFRGGAAALLTSAALVLGGCAEDTAGPETGTDVEDIQEDPAAGVFEDFDDAESFVGQEVTVSAEVSEIISPNAFTIADDAGEALLVLYDGTPQLNVDTPVQVTGTVQRVFDIAAAEAFTGADLNDTLYEPFTGEPYIQASNIDTTVTSPASPTPAGPTPSPTTTAQTPPTG